MISMKKVNYAAIDIGSNAVRLLIKCVNEENAPELMSKVQLIRIPLRLGEDAFTVGVISTEKEKKLIRLMKAYKQLMKIYDVVDYRACATSAMRDARNGKDIVQQIVKKTGIRVEIIDGQEEAHIVYDNHIEQLFASGQNYLYVDVGGGSTEINLISNGELKNSRSYNIGTVRMLSGMVKEEEKEALRTDLIGLATEYTPISIIGSGGNINKLFRLADKKDKKASYRLSYAFGQEQCYTGNKIEGTRFFPSWLCDEKEQFVQASLHSLHQHGFSPKIRKYNFCTNGSHYAGEAGIPTFGMGPSREDLAHTVDEFIELSQLSKAVICYEAIMEALLGNRFCE